MGHVVHREKNDDPQLVQEVESHLEGMKHPDREKQESLGSLKPQSRQISPMLLELERQIQTLYDELSESEYDDLDPIDDRY